LKIASGCFIFEKIIEEYFTQASIFKINFKHMWKNDYLCDRIWSAGIYFDNNKFTNKTYFAPFAYKTELNTRKYQVEDLARYVQFKSFLFLVFS
jgi:hypothetical protein